VAFYCDYIEGWPSIDEYPLPHAWDVQHPIDGQYAHPSAKICAERNAAGLFQDAGRLEAREPDGAPPEHPTPGQHGESALRTESMPAPKPPPAAPGKE